MNCYFHPQAEGVVTCGKCGIAMCKECEEKAFFRLDGGTGQALCNRCSLTEAQANVNFKSSWLKRRMIKLIFCSIFVIIGLIALLSYKASGELGTGIFLAIICWAISGAISNIGNKNNDSVKNQVRNAAFEYNHPFLSMIAGIIGNAIFGPIILIIDFIGYAKIRVQYSKDLKDLETIKAAMNQ